MIPPSTRELVELGNYRLGRLIGRGGMSEVYVGEHRFLGDKVAVKILHGQYANRPEISQRFFQEASATRSIDHPAIVRILDFGQASEGTLYLVMELLEGETWSTALERGPMREPHAARIGAQIADGLAAAHAKGIVHRDLKPQNICLVGDQVKIIDFGIAKVQDVSITQTGTVLGTPKYMAPEQTRHPSVVGPHTDIYALGALLFEALTGKPPFDAEDIHGVMMQIIAESPRPPSSLRPVSPEMDALVLQCLQKDGAARPRTMIEVRDRLSRLTGGDLQFHTGASSSRSFVAAPTSSSLRRWTWISSAGAGLVTLLGIVAVVHRQPSRSLSATKITSTLPPQPTPQPTPMPQPKLPATSPAPAPRTPPPAAAPNHAPPPLQPALVRLRLRLTPPQARAELDGVEVAAGAVGLPSSNQSHRLVVSAPGYQTVTRAVRAIDDGDIVVNLKKNPPAKRPTGTPQPQEKILGWPAGE